jgi:putative transposase
MARLGRYFLPDQPQHLIQRGNNRGTVFFSLDDRLQYLDWLREAAADFDCRIHAYVLMTNHVHLLVTPGRDNGLRRMMQTHGRRYVRYVNAGLRRTGTLWEGRYRAAPITATAISSPAAATSSSTRCGRGWSITRAPTNGRAFAHTPRVRRIR